jgi:choline dehydrogenase-like flavoprotein
MGEDPGESVIGPDCRTHDVGNLYLAGCGVFPTSGAMQPTLTIAAMALRLAERLDRVL